MTESMEQVLQSLSADLRPPATRLWKQAGAVSDITTETLLATYKVLRHMRGDPALLQSGTDLLSGRVTAELQQAQADLDRTYPAVTRAWQGGGAEALAGYLPRLSEAIGACQQRVGGTVSAVTGFRDSVLGLWDKIIDRTARTAGEVTTHIHAAGELPQLAAGAVVDTVEQFADYVEDLAESLMRLRGDAHLAGATLQSAAQPQAGLVADGDELRLPRWSADAADASAWRPSDGTLAMDTAAMAELTSALSDNGRRWQAASAGSREAATDHLVPEAFGLAGAHFYDDLHAVLTRDQRLYASADSHMDNLADALRRIGAEYVAGDDAAAAELRRGLTEE